MEKVKKRAADWFEDLAEPYRSQAYDNVYAQYNGYKLQRKYTSLKNALMYTMNWYSTDQGEPYWRNIHANCQAYTTSAFTNLGINPLTIERTGNHKHKYYAEDSKNFYQLLIKQALDIPREKSIVILARSFIPSLKADDFITLYIKHHFLYGVHPLVKVYSQYRDSYKGEIKHFRGRGVIILYKEK